MVKYFVLSVVLVSFVFMGCAAQDDSVNEASSIRVSDASAAPVEDVMEEEIIAISERVSSVENVETAEPESVPDDADEDFIVYLEKGSRKNHYIPSGFMGDYSDIKMNLGHKDDPKAGETCIEFIYKPNRSQGAGWAGVYWLNPANNWGATDGGYDLSGARKLTFWARGKEGGERIEELKMGGIYGNYSDTDSAGIGPTVLEKEWKKYEIDLTNKDLSSIIGGFVWSTNLDVNPEGATFYIDDIRYER